jgi:phosphoribosylformylglycinamidine cyclo-ligase
MPEFGGATLAEELLRPTRVYARDCLALAGAVEVHAFAHITGGGLAGNLVRVLPAHLDAEVDRATWQPQAVFDLVARTAGVSQEQMELTFNLGVGMVAVVAAPVAGAALELLGARGVPAWELGRVVAGTGRVRMAGAYPGPAADW